MLLNTRIIKGVFALLCMGILLSASLAQQTPAPATAKQSQEDRTALHQALLDLTNPWTVMCIAAHPDDEDGTSLIVMRRKHGAHTVSLFTTFGEGGQNAIGPELYEELGAIRIRETKAASEIQGSEPYFLGLKDFGYSKSAEEAFRIWGHEESLRRMVLQIRKLRPDVIITNHDTSRGHGHHQATGQLILEAFDAAADPKQFPDQLRWDIQPWQVQRLFVRAFGGAPASSGQKPEGVLVTIDPNERDAIRGTIFAEQALQALQQHATQGPWPGTVADMARFRNSPDGKLPLIRYRLVREPQGAGALPKDSNNFLDGLQLPEKVAKELKVSTIDARPLTELVDQRRQILDTLVANRKSAKFRPEKSNDAPRFRRMDERLDAAFAAVTRITAITTPRDAVVIPGSPTAFTVTISNNGDIPTTVYSYTFFAGERNVKTLYTGSSPFPPGDRGSVTDDWEIPPETVPSLPHAKHLYDGRVFGDKFKEVVVMNLAGIQFSVSGSTHVEVGPSVEITNLSPSPIVRTPAANKRTLRGVDCAYRDSDFNLRLTNHQDAPLSGKLVTGSATAKNASSLKIAVRPHESVSVAAHVSGCLPWINSKVDVKAPISFTIYGSGASKPLARLDVPVVWADARVAPNLRVGYVRGFDYSLPNALAALGVESKELSIGDIRAGDLQQYSAILIDNRVYESQPEMIATNQRLLDYAKEGGTVIVFYHKSNEWNPNPRVNRPQLAPYLIVLGDERVTDENAAVTFIAPEHALLNSPNKIGQEDFAGWIQERGLYYPKEWDVKYQALLAMNDPGEAPLRGGLLVADYGRGHYIYTSMVWYRQLRAGVPGAYDMLANMISYGK